ncbi:MAG: CDP-alcohol phosphatidyltransferase family protein [Myxococcales bacterium]|nr:CDP-alcohol phosphatidyltransferase family protein [Myxococcales bacterium]
MRAVIVTLPSPMGPRLAPDARIAGLAVLLRCVLALQQKGVRHVTVAHRPEDADAVHRALRDERVRVAVELASVPTGEPVAVRLLGLTEPCLFVRHDGLAAPELYARVLATAAAVPNDASVAAVPNDPAAPAAVAAFAHVVVDAERPVGIAVLTAAAFAQLGPNGELDLLVQRADVARIALAPSWLCDARSTSGRDEAVRRLFFACRKPVDGVVSRHLNRYISLFISRLLVDTRVTPNLMTLFTFALALAAAWFATRGLYAHTLVAALLMQLNSILDGCDGELARVRYQGTKLGQWLDTVGDDASNILFWAALGFGARTLPDGATLAVAGYTASLANALAAGLNYVLLARLKTGDFYALTGSEPRRRAGVVSSVAAVFEVVLKQDFFKLLLVVVALAGVLERALPVMAVGALITFANSLVRFVRVLFGKSSLRDRPATAT